MRLALLVSPESFESFYAEMLELDRRSFVESYRNDFVWDYATALRERGIEVAVYVASHHERGVEVAPDGFRVRFLPIPRWAWTCLAVIRHARTPVERYVGEVVNAASVLRPLRVGLAEDQADALYIQEYWTGRFDLLAHRLRLPIVAGEHGGSEGRHLHVFKARALQRAAAITCQSHAERDRLERYGIRAQLVPNGVDAGFYSPPPGPEARDPTVLVVARLHDAQKRISDVIQALALLPAEWRLEIVGSGPDEADLRALASSCGVAERTRFLGFVADKKELRSLYQRCGVFALPSRWEAMTIALLEAMSCGAPAVVTPLRPFADLIDNGRNGFFCAHDDPPGLAATILTAYEQRREVGAAARTTIERGYAREATMGRLAELLEATIRS